MVKSHCIYSFQEKKSSLSHSTKQSTVCPYGPGLLLWELRPKPKQKTRPKSSDCVNNLEYIVPNRFNQSVCATSTKHWQSLTDSQQKEHGNSRLQNVTWTVNQLPFIPWMESRDPFPRHNAVRYLGVLRHLSGVAVELVVDGKVHLACRWFFFIREVGIFLHPRRGFLKIFFRELVIHFQ